ncbi:hypothetical protein [Streptomyces sp. NPDC056682]|uniref:hypothetical protein n=1 Tax=Streptomyces sp. NPDC056682 TaxID=3345909 RepID=UPI0036D1A090
MGEAITEHEAVKEPVVESAAEAVSLFQPHAGAWCVVRGAWCVVKDEDSLHDVGAVAELAHEAPGHGHHQGLALPVEAPPAPTASPTW